MTDPTSPTPTPGTPEPAREPGVDLETRIARVTVFRQGARVTRVGTTSLPPGDHQLRVPGLPRSLDYDSVRVKGTGRGSIVNINVEETLAEETPQEELDALRTRLKEVEHQQADLQRRLDLVTRRQALTDDFHGRFYENFPKFFAAGEITFDRYQQLDAHVFQAKETLSEQARDLSRDLDRVRITRTKLKRQMNKLGGRGDVEPSYTVGVNLSVPAATGGEETEFTLEVSYIIADAHWRPLYDVNLGDETARVKFLANIVNYTTEDWPKVMLEVSTTTIQPVTMTKPDPLVLRERQIYEERRRREKRGGKRKRSMAPPAASITDGDMDMHEAPTARKPKPEPAPMEEVQGEVADSVGVQSYKLPAPVSVPSDKNPHPVTLTTVDLPSTKKLFWSVANPGTVVAQDTLANGDLVLLPGSAKIYHAEEYLGETAVPLIAPKQEFDLGTRVSYDVTVTRKLVDRSRDKKLLKGKIRRHYAYAIKVKNLAGVACPLKLVDRVPHADSEKIKVDVDFGATPPAKNKLGVVTWTLDLAGVTETEIAYTYTVSYDKDMRVTPSLP